MSWARTPSRRAAWIVLAALASFVGAPRAVRADARDPWWGTDKALHLSVSAGLALGGYAVGIPLFERPPARFVLGGAIALGAGIAKELADLAGVGDASWRDFFWDVVGTALGLVLGWALDCALADACRASP